MNLPALAQKGDILDLETGEVISLKKATEIQVSSFLSEVNRQRRDLDKLEKKIKSVVKKRVGVEFDDNIMFGRHKINKYFYSGFDTKRFEAEATEEEKTTYNEIKKKYTLISERIKIA